TGGDGAPGWTLELAGMDLANLQETGAAIVHALYGDPFPRMIWPTNAHKLAAATMFALFFAGNDLAPNTLMHGEPAQEFLQRHYIASIRRLAHALRDLPNVVGFDTMNEPMRGYMGVDDLDDCCGRPRMGDFPTPLNAMLLAEGIPQEVGVWGLSLTGNRRLKTRLINPNGTRLWKDGFECVWRKNGVWDLDFNGNPRLLRPHHFSQVNGQKMDFNQDYYRPFANRYAREIRAEMPEALIFLESEPSTPAPRWSEGDAANIVFAPHWYDVTALLFKRFSAWVAANYHTGKLVLGPSAIKRSFQQQLAHFKEEAAEHMRGAPVLIGEFGIPFDLNNKRAYQTGDFSQQAKAMDRSMAAMEANFISSTLWNYSPDNNNRHGDQWNDEDLSIFSPDQQTDPTDINSGGRALTAVVRPYPIATAGKPVSLAFDIRNHVMSYTFEHDPQIDAPTEIYLPCLHYPRGVVVDAQGGRIEQDPQNQRLRYFPTSPGGIHSLKIRPV
ncbi:MAG TPA: cellulase family glycosylhydrolase, partial [Anaerolinea sp.]|nr:cellulase family glycosylhydrolase [Anaerolinea sp.]